ncbi:MAG TPA: cytochrome c biogenesis protein CcsA [Gemmataceae bacterium]|nr:cytochrome c biogenesis protein CcsA [Gemmataceae bacterium]
MTIDRITIFCFAASYTLALCLELLQLLRPRAFQRLLCSICGIAGLLAHTLFLLVQHPALVSRQGSLLFLAWILAVFYLYGSIHYRRSAWGAFVLPVVLGLTILAHAFDQPSSSSADSQSIFALHGEGFWRMLHVILFVLASVGVCIAFIASLMYLVQARRLRSKAIPGQGLRLFSLERLEAMNRRAINAAFPLLSAGLLIGIALMLEDRDRLEGWTDPRILSTLVLWLVFAVMLYLRYGVHLHGRRVALLTIVAFALLLLTLVTQHSLTPGGRP